MFKHLLLAFSLATLSLRAASLQCSSPVTFFDTRFKCIEKPLMDSNDQGEATIIWAASKNENTEQTAHVAFKTANTSWSETQTLPSLGKLKRIDLAVDTAGKTSLHWRSCKSGKCYTYYGQKTPDEFWAVPFNVADKSDSSGEVKLLPSGKIIFLGEKETMFGEVLETVKNIPCKFIQHVTPADKQHLFINSNGDGFAFEVHRNWRDDTYQMKYSWFEEDQFSPSQILGSISLGYLNKVTGVTSENKNVKSGAVALIPYSEERIPIITFTNGQWSLLDTFIIKREGLYNCALAMNPQDDIFVAWGSSENQGIEAALKPKGQDWISTLPILPFKGEFRLKEIKSDQTGNFIVIWKGTAKVLRHLIFEERESIYGAVFSIKDRTWSDPVLLSRPALSCSSPSLTLTQPGHGFVSWIASNGFDTGVQVVELSYEE